MTESQIQTHISKQCHKHGITVFRNNVGTAWRGDVHRLVGGVQLRVAGGGVVTQSAGDLLIRKPQLVRFGLIEGSSDLIGWRKITVTPDMVGKQVAIFTALEVKSPKGRLSEPQRIFIEQVNRSGGMAGLVRSESDMVEVIKQFTSE